MRRAVLAAVAGAGLGVAAFAVSLAVAPYPVADFAAVRAAWRPADAWLLDRHGEPLSRVRIDRERRRGEWTALADVSPSLVKAVIASEDRRFREHAGVDWVGLAGAAVQSSRGGRRGGSTLTMQLAAQLEPRLETGGHRDLVDKWRQVRQALALERTWTKDQVLEAWLNLTPFRGEVEGVDAAARALAGKRPSGLDRAESAIVAVLARAPNAAPAAVTRRACALLEGDAASCARAERLALRGLRAGGLAAAPQGDAPHLARRLLSFPGERRVSSLDARLQRFAEDSLARHLGELAGRHVEDGAVVVLDNATGEVLAWVGSSGELSRAPAVDGVIARRQAGSTLKPFLYSLAIERRLLTAASLLDDSPLAVPTGAGLYVPQNYDRGFRGEVSLRQALAGSLNIPAVRTAALVGVGPFHERLRRLGFATLERDAEHYGLGLALGGGEVRLVDLANAYRALANGGRAGPVRFDVAAGAPPPGEPVVDPRAAFVVADILADAGARAATFGLASPLATAYRASVKTGTSKDMRDNWAVGFTDRHTVGVWVGNFGGESMHDVSGISGAAPVWRDVMDFLAAARTPREPAAPPGLERARVHFAAGGEPDRDEWFLAGTRTAIVEAAAPAAGHPRLESPVDGAIFAMDPDIPPSRQRIALRARGAGEGERLVLPDGREVPAGEAVLWAPAPGRHRLALVDRAGRELDRAEFEVRP